MTNTAVSVSLTVEINLDDWREEYGLQDLPTSFARDDIRAAAGKVFEDWLRENIGFRSASVRVNPPRYRNAGFRQ